eukprot:NODE_538_length_1384_cov_122.234686_g503_i0.p1 GENE.NODE_538_length_1384_cov_122.234686_g503_i0~~NODE_538_length_1384_cov_122.234686_g503_i0.p1  ORF type:complete len:405 (-),score=48.01 NODE_538_length_1384_cov_122.234686_g503_i0:91-1305(-)
MEADLPQRICHLRQVALVTRQPQELLRALQQFCGTKVTHSDPLTEKAFGVRQWILPLQHSFLEVLTPIRDDSSIPAQRYLNTYATTDDWALGYVAMVQTQKDSGLPHRMETNNVQCVRNWEHNGMTCKHWNPKTLGGGILLETDVVSGQDEDRLLWPCAGPMDTWCDYPVGNGYIAGIELAVPDAADVCNRWAKMFARGSNFVQYPDSCAAVLYLENAQIRFIQSAKRGLQSLEIATRDTSLVGTSQCIGGLRFQYVSDPVHPHPNLGPHWIWHDPFVMHNAIVYTQDKKEAPVLLVYHKHLNAGGILHGGAVFAFADEALFDTAGTPSLNGVTINMSCNLMAPVLPGQVLYCDMKHSITPKFAFATGYIYAELPVMNDDGSLAGKRKRIADLTGIIKRISSKL